MKITSLKALKESGKRKLFLVPHFFTLTSAFFGFLAVIKTFDYEFITAAYCIMLAVLMDFLDGRLARVFHSSSYFGMELDSLSDAISFCFAPAVLLYSWYLDEAGLIGVFALTAYLCAGLLRLAKFNVSSTTKQPKKFFTGLPTTAAAFLVVQLVAHFRWIASSWFRFLLHPIGILIFILFVAFLMISPIRFYSFKRLRLPVFVLVAGIVAAVLIVAISAIKGFPLIFFVLLGYIIGSIALELYSLIQSIFDF